MRYKDNTALQARIRLIPTALSHVLTLSRSLYLVYQYFPPSRTVCTYRMHVHRYVTAPNANHCIGYSHKLSIRSSLGTWRGGDTRPSGIGFTHKLENRTRTRKTENQKKEKGKRKNVRFTQLDLIPWLSWRYDANRISHFI